MTSGGALSLASVKAIVKASVKAHGDRKRPGTITAISSAGV
jgi:hypothetical protein